VERLGNKAFNDERLKETRHRNSKRQDTETQRDKTQKLKETRHRNAIDS